MENITVGIIMSDGSHVQFIERKLDDKGDWIIPAYLGSYLFWNSERPCGIVVLEDGGAPIPVGASAVTPYGKETCYTLTRV